MRQLGGAGLVTSAVGLNCLSFAQRCGAAGGPAAAAAVVPHALDSGITMIDATEFGSAGVCRAVGRALRGRRDEVVLAVRGGGRFTPRGRQLALDGRPGRVAAACDTALRRLGVDHLDLYFLAGVDPAVPLAETMGAMAQLIKEGKVRQLGLSNVDVDALRLAYAIHPVAALGRPYSLLERGVEAELLPAARALGVALVAYRPLAGGLLTGRLRSIDQLPPDDYRRYQPLFRPQALARSSVVLRAIERFAAARHLSPSRLALAWLLGQGPDIVVLPGTRSRTHLEMNIAAAEIRLSAAESAQLAALATVG